MKRIIFIFLLLLTLVVAGKTQKLITIDSIQINAVTGGYSLTLFGEDTEGDYIAKTPATVFADSAAVIDAAKKEYKPLFERIYQAEDDMYRAYRLSLQERQANQKLIQTLNNYANNVTMSGDSADDYWKAYGENNARVRYSLDFNSIWFSVEPDSINHFFVRTDGNGFTEVNWTNPTISAALDSLAAGISNYGLTPKVGGISGKLIAPYALSVGLTGANIPDKIKAHRFFYNPNVTQTPLAILNTALSNKGLEVRCFESFDGEQLFLIQN